MANNTAVTSICVWRHSILRGVWNIFVILGRHARRTTWSEDCKGAQAERKGSDFVTTWFPQVRFSFSRMTAERCYESSIWTRAPRDVLFLFFVALISIFLRILQLFRYLRSVPLLWMINMRQVSGWIYYCRRHDHVSEMYYWYWHDAKNDHLRYISSLSRPLLVSMNDDD